MGPILDECSVPPTPSNQNEVRSFFACSKEPLCVKVTRKSHKVFYHRHVTCLPLLHCQNGSCLLSTKKVPKLEKSND